MGIIISIIVISVILGILANYSMMRDAMTKPDDTQVSFQEYFSSLKVVVLKRFPPIESFYKFQLFPFERWQIYHSSSNA